MLRPALNVRFQPMAFNLAPSARRALPSGCRSLAAPGENKAKSSDRRLLPDRPKATGLAVALLDEVVHQLAGAVVHLDVERLHLTSKVVEGHNGRDRDQQPERRRYQGLRDTAGDRADTRGLLGGNLLEGVQEYRPPFRTGR